MKSTWFLWIAMAFMTCVGTLSAQAETIHVTITDLVFSPAVVEAKIGDTIIWDNNDVIAHTATVKGGWDVKIPPKKSASLVLKKAENSEYYCRYHPNMKGSINVTAP